MSHAMYLRQQAERLLSLACATIDLGIARRLRLLAGEFRAKADELDDDPALPLHRRRAAARQTTRR